jgi:hypothetical protein
MSDTARDYQTDSPVSIEGLEQIFAPMPHENPSGTDGILMGTDETAACLSETLRGYTVSEIVNLLGLPRSTVYRQINNGKFHTEKGLDGKLRILLRQSEIPVLSTETLCNLAEIPFETVETVPFSREKTPETGEIPCEKPETNNSSKVDIAELLRKLEAATYRIGYLESKLEDRDEKIKLLTDSQHKGGWWAKFSSWFFKAR